MADIFRDLSSILRKEANKQKEILSLLSEERELISTLQNDQIDRIAQLKNHVIAEAQVLERQRIKLVSTFNLRPKQGNKQVKIDDIIEICENEKSREELESAKTQLKEFAVAVNKMNLENASLIYDTLGVVSSTLSIMLSSHDESVPTYEKSGEMKKEKKATKLNSTLRASV